MEDIKRDYFLHKLERICEKYNCKIVNSIFDEEEIGIYGEEENKAEWLYDVEKLKHEVDSISEELARIRLLKMLTGWEHLFKK